MKKFFLLLMVMSVLQSWIGKKSSFTRKDKLSEYNFFVGELEDLTPAEGVLRYNVNAPLFSNYAEKLRFVKIPQDEKAQFNDSTSFSFPLGTVLIKNFYYPVDARRPEKGRQILETRLLVNEETGWQAYPYIWNEEQSEAYYDPAGETKTVSYVALSGKKVTAPYVIPNKNQCKGCHISAGKIQPIGVTARQLNRMIVHGGGETNQLHLWKALGMLNDVPSGDSIPSLAEWDNPSMELNGRARAYLDANCGHCHRPEGPASTSGLILTHNEFNPSRLGVGKTPVAAGKGSGKLQYDIVPGHPEQSILLFRMNTNDPSIAMPEIGREQIHKEGVALIEEWIRKNDFGPR